MNQSTFLPRVLSGAVLAGVTSIVLLMCGCRTAKVTGEEQFSDAPADKPTIVYVADFGLVPGEIEDDKGILSEVPIVKRPAKLLLYGQEPPTERARQLVNLMSTSLVKDLETRGFTAERYSPENEIPTNGWLVRGMYTKVQEGNKLQRTLVGFGAGETEVQVVTVFDDLSKGPPQPLYQVDTKADSGKLPGSAPLLVLSPYPTAARFILSGTDLERNVKQTARKIADMLEEYVNGKSQ